MDYKDKYEEALTIIHDQALELNRREMENKRQAIRMNLAESALAAAPRWVRIEECDEPAVGTQTATMKRDGSRHAGVFPEEARGQWNDIRAKMIEKGVTHILLIPPPPEV